MCCIHKNAHDWVLNKLKFNLMWYLILTSVALILLNHERDDVDHGCDVIEKCITLINVANSYINPSRIYGVW